MNYAGTVDYLYGLQKYGIKLGLEKTRSVMACVGNPHRDFRSIHVAGTNGKGSVSAMIAYILISCGFRVGLFTSPHLVSFTERIRTNGEKITESEVIDLTEEVRSRISELNPDLPEPTFFEFVTAMAFLYFSRKNVDWAVIEVGMGGRLDATNVITPAVSVITNVSHDHKDFLGETLAEIASEKAGIIKEGVPVVSAAQKNEVKRIIREISDARMSKFFFYGDDFSGLLKNSDINGLVFDYRNGSDTVTDLRTPLAGDHQLVNACLAVKAAMTALAGCGQSEKNGMEDKIRNGLASTKWQGRLEVVSTDPLIMIDGAHNPDAAETLSVFIKKQLSDYSIILITGIMADKDVAGILKHLLPVASNVILTSPDYGRAASPQALAECASSLGVSDAVCAISIREALGKAGDIYASLSAHCRPLILITGSFYTIGEAKEALGEKSVLGGLRETL